jgi:hypothetical protein
VNSQPYSISEFDLRSQLAEVRREVQWRRVGFPKLVARGSMTEDDAARRSAAMEAVLQTLTKLAALEDKAKQLNLI